MRVAVFDLPAAGSGALSILKDFHAHVCRAMGDDVEWIFVVSTDALENDARTPHVKILRYPRAKRNWATRLLFEAFQAPRLVRELSADVVVSLQSTAVMFCSLPQIVYVHQSLPYAPRRFSLIKPDETFLSIYAAVFRVLIGWSVHKAHAVVVQTRWLREAIVRTNRIPGDKVYVVPPAVRLLVPATRVVKEPGAFFYPTTPYVYKNIERIVDAVALLRKADLNPVIYLTILGEENSHARRLRGRIQAAEMEDSFRFMGRIDRSEVIRYYRRAVLLFPSTLESFGLPLLEGRLAGATIVASDMPFCREILAGYLDALFFDPWDAREMAAAMRCCMQSEASLGNYSPATSPSNEVASEDHWQVIVDLARRAGLARVPLGRA